MWENNGRDRYDEVNQLLALEAAVRYQMPPVAGQDPFSYEAGDLPLLITAPHSTLHRRGKEWREEEEYTAAVARFLAQECGAHLLFATHRLEFDPSWEAHNPFRSRIRQAVQEYGIRFVLDIHGASLVRDFGIALGTVEGVSSPPERAATLRILEAHGFGEAQEAARRIDVDHHLPARAGHSVTRLAWEELGVAAMQLSLHADLRIVRRFKDASSPYPFHGNPALISNGLQALLAVTRHLAQL